VKLVSINNAEINMILARNVYDDFGKVLLAEGAILTDYFIDKLKQFKVNSFYIVDGITSKAEISSQSLESNPVQKKSAGKKILCDEAEVDEAVKDETALDIVKLTNDLLDRLMGKTTLKFMTTDMESFHYSNESQAVATQMPDNIGIPADDSGMTSRMTTKTSGGSVQESSNSGESTVLSDGWHEKEVAAAFQQIIHELQQLEGYYKTAQSIDDPTRFMVTNSISDLISAFHDLEALYTTSAASGVFAGNSQFEVPYLMSNIMAELDQLKTHLPDAGSTGDSAQFNTSNRVQNICNQLSLLENIFTKTIPNPNFNDAAGSDKQEGSITSSAYPNLIKDLNELERMAALITGKTMEAPGGLNLSNTVAKIRGELNALHDSFNSYISSAQPITDRAKQEILQRMNQMIQKLNEQKYALISIGHQAMDDQAKSKMLGMLEGAILEIKKLETTYMVAMQRMLNDQTRAPEMNARKEGPATLIPNQQGSSGISPEKSPANYIKNLPGYEERRLAMDPVKSGQDQQSTYNQPMITSKSAQYDPNKPNQDNQFLTTHAVKRPLENDPANPMTITRPMANPDPTAQGNITDGKTVSSPGYTHRGNIIDNKGIPNPERNIQGYIPDNKISANPERSSQGNIPNGKAVSNPAPTQTNKELIKSEALKITNSLLDDLSGQIDVNQMANSIAGVEFSKITSSIMENLNNKYGSNPDVMNKVKAQAYQIVQEAMNGIREEITRNDATRKVVSTILKEVITNDRLVHLMVNLRGTSQETFNHCISVYVLTTMTGIGAGYSHTLLKDLATAALLHDIGKIQVPESILNKIGELTENEMEEMQKHTQYGYDILVNYEGFTHIPAIVALHHHERIDGSGYPNGLKAKEIHQYARIVALSDVYDSLLNDKSNKRRNLPYEIIEYIRDLSGKLFDADYAKIFLQNIEPFPIGSMVRLNTGEKAIVYKLSKDLPTRPVVRVVIDKNGDLIAKPYDRDLKKELTFFVLEVLSV
jgi:HD-GYP domain-containing protein (c-di-GMP phosphodiesterase class II)